MATLYCGPSNTGAGTGSNFSNLLALPDTTGFTRGNTYIIVDGSYGSKTLSTATSGSTPITIKKASAADSGVAGYAASLHDGAATFDILYIQSQYWIVNGVTRTETNVMEAPAGYGIRVTDQVRSSYYASDVGYNSQFLYIDMGSTWATNPGAGTILGYGSPIYITGQVNMTFTRCCMHNGGHNGALAMIHGSNGTTFDHCDFYMGWGKATIAAPNDEPANTTVKYCRFWNSTQYDPNDPTSGTTAEIGSYSTATDHVGHLIYGNVIYNNVSPARTSVIMYGEPALAGEAQNCKIFNNTIVGCLSASMIGAELYLKGGSGNEIRNNLFYDTGGASASANTVSNTVDATSNPFIAGGYPTTLDFRLSSTSQARNAGVSVGSPYNVDPLGVTRGADGTWDVGAYEYDAGGTPPTGTVVLSVR